ncbi:MAG TPA: hypothetical protein VKB79_10600 [Bryobacteraceae bacterium]|nr:hypothetical protein [Bryobacteraceae bacterium]
MSTTKQKYLERIWNPGFKSGVRLRTYGRNMISTSTGNSTTAASIPSAWWKLPER